MDADNNKYKFKWHTMFKPLTFNTCQHNLNLGLFKLSLEFGKVILPLNEDFNSAEHLNCLGKSALGVKDLLVYMVEVTNKKKVTTW